MAIKPFKQYQRGQRQQFDDQPFNGGMWYTDKPIPAGFNRCLVNYTIQDKGENLKSRPPYNRGDRGFKGTAGLSYDGHFSPEDRPVVAYNGWVFNSVLAYPNPAYQPKKGLCVLMKGRPEGTLRNPYILQDISKVDDPYHSKELIIGGNHHFLFCEPSKVTGLNNINILPEYVPNFEEAMCTVGFNGTLIAHIGDTEASGTYDAWAHLAVINEDTINKKVAGGYDPLNPYPEFKQPKELQPSEATTWGYNMLANAPYAFSNGTTGAQITLTGLLPYRGGDLCLNPKVNESINFRCYYSVEPAQLTGYTFKFEWKDIVGSAWNVFATAVSPVSGVVQASMLNPGREIIVRVTATKASQETVLAQGFNFTLQSTPFELKNYSLQAAHRLGYWERHTVIYKLRDLPGAIFVSDLDDPSYYPYPNNCEEFESDVLHVCEYQSSLLVFCRNHIYALTWNEDGISWNRTVIQKGITLTEEDTPFITVLKSFVMFKKGNMFYLITPSASMAGSLSIAPISKPIEEFLNDLKSGVDETLANVYNYKDGWDLTYYNTTTTLDAIYINLYLKVKRNYPQGDTEMPLGSGTAVGPNGPGTPGLYDDPYNPALPTLKENLVFSLVYDTLMRTWSITIFGIITNVYSPNMQDTNLFLVNYPETRINLPSYAVVQASTAKKTYFDPVPSEQRYFFEIHDIVPDETSNILQDFSFDTNRHDLRTTFPNHQLLDTGHKDIESTIKKMFREFQYMIHTPDSTLLKFRTKFFVDGEQRKWDTKTMTEVVEDPDNPGMYILNIAETLVYDDLFYLKQQITKLAKPGGISDVYPPEGIDPTPPPPYPEIGTDDVWFLDLSQFNRKPFWKIRNHVKGKGYADRIVIVAENKELFEVLVVSHVYRLMNTR